MAAQGKANSVLASYLHPAGVSQRDVTITLVVDHGRRAAPLRANSVIEGDSHSANAQPMLRARKKNGPAGDIASLLGKLGKAGRSPGY